MRFAFVAILMSLSVGSATADCASIGREATAKFKVLNEAKELYKKEFAEEQKREFGPESIDRIILSTTKMKIAMDISIASLLESQANNCFGKEAANWAVAIPQMQNQSDDLGRSREDYLAKQRMMQDVLRRKQGR
jgi:hypothetical protein